MPLTALLLALAAAFVHALWNLLLARARDPEAATAVALVVAVVVFAPVAPFAWGLEREVWPYLAVTSCLQLLYFALLITAYRKSDVSVVYPVARGVAPVIVLLAGIAVLGYGTSLAQAAGVVLVGLGVLAIRGFRRGADAAGVVFGLAIAAVIASYTLVDKRGLDYATPIAYLEVSMVAPALLYAAWVARLRGGAAALERLARNERLVAMIEQEFVAARAASENSGQPARRFKDFQWSTIDSWSRRRRVIAKAEWTQGEANPRFIVTSLKRAEAAARYLYEDIYCARGDMENRIKECQLDLYADRTSAATMHANQLRLWFASMAYVLICALRRIGLAKTAFANATCGTIRLKLLKIGALIRISVRRVRIAMASACPAADDWARAARRLADAAKARASPA